MSEQVSIVITKSSEFRLVYATGVFGGLSPLDGRLIFFVDRIVPKVQMDAPGQLKTGSVERELQVEVHMSPQEFISLYEWMKSHIDRLEKEGILSRKEEAPAKTE